MPDTSYITPAMQQAIGVETEPRTYEVEKGHIARFADAIGDPSPLYTDEKAARETRYGSLIAPPTMFRAFSPGQPKVDVIQELPLKRVLDAGSEWEWFGPVRPGDRIAVTARLASMEQKSGRLGPMALVTTEVLYRNQFGELVAIQRQSNFRY